MLPLPPDFAEVFLDKQGNIEATARHYGRHSKTVRRWIGEANLPDVKLAGLSLNASGGISRRFKVETLPLPARTAGWSRPKPKKHRKSKTRFGVICGDVHAPLHDPALERKFESFLADTTPDFAINVGDLCENAGTSRWKNRPGQPTEQECINAGYRWLRRKIEVSPNTTWDWIEGNHDLRPEQYAADNASAIAGLAQAETDQPVLAVEHLLRLDELKVNYHRGYPLAKIKLTDNLVVAHGGAVKKGSGSSALANLEKRGFSIITGHTHRLAIVFKTVLDADDTPSTLCGAESGCMKLIEPEPYDVAPDHQNGFLTVTLFPDGQFHIEPALMSGGHLRWRDRRF